MLWQLFNAKYLNIILLKIKAPLGIHGLRLTFSSYSFSSHKSSDKSSSFYIFCCRTSSATMLACLALVDTIRIVLLLRISHINLLVCQLIHNILRILNIKQCQVSSRIYPYQQRIDADTNGININNINWRHYNTNTSASFQSFFSTEKYKKYCAKLAIIAA